MAASDDLTAERLFERYFLPLYPPDARADLGRARRTDANPAGNPSILAQIDEAAAIFARLAPAALGAPDLVLDFTDASIHHLSPLLTREIRDAWLAGGHVSTRPPDPSPAQPASPLLVTMVTHGAFYVGATIVRAHGGAWQVRRPLWESAVRLVSAAGTGDLSIFHWWLKALSDDDDRRGTASPTATAPTSRCRPSTPSASPSSPRPTVASPASPRSVTTSSTSTSAPTCPSCATSAPTSPRPSASTRSASSTSTSRWSAAGGCSCSTGRAPRGCTSTGSPDRGS